MSDNNPFTQPYAQAYTEAFSKFVPGFDFLQGLVKNAGQALPGIGQWVAPTLDPQELERRISELRTVQFWLEQNARMIATTVQALEVQRMTLGTLRSMNVPMGDLSDALKMRVPDVFTAAAAASAPAAAPAPAPAPAAAAAGTEAPGAIDPMQWWGALTQQFTQLATQAMKATSEATAEATAQATQAVQATTVAAAEARARAADAVQDVIQTVAAAAPAAEAAAAKAPAKKAAAKKATARKTAAKSTGKAA